LNAIRIRSFVAVLGLSDEPQRPWLPALPPGDTLAEWMLVERGPLRLWFRPREPAAHRHLPSVERTAAWLLGDEGECRSSGAAVSLVNAATVSFDAARRRLTLFTSIIGLPPVFVHADRRRAILASDLYLIAGVPDVRLEFDPAAVVEFARIGHPTFERTLYKRTRLLPAGSRVVVDPESGLTTERAWRPPDPESVTWEQFVDRQIAAFTDAIRRIDLSKSFLSLTAGLDTRTIFMTLADQRRLVPAATMSGVRPSLDARIAAALCREYGVPHTIVEIGQRFRRQLPDYLYRASRLSGGLASIRQAPEVHFYDQLAGRFAARLSGNLGNQVGRGGTEGISTRDAGLSLLSPELRKATGFHPRHWLLDDLSLHGRRFERLLQHGVTPAAVGNYTIGNHFAIQQSPYADRALVETLALRPPGGLRPSASPISMRLRDVRHRFLGEPRSTSFQRSLLNRLGGRAATWPINFGWRARGGVSPAHVVRGVAALADMLAEKRHVDRSTRWIHGALEAFARDITGSRAVRESGVFDPRIMDRVVDEHFSRRRDHYESVTLALDLALAHEQFCAAPRAVIGQRYSCDRIA